MKKLFQIAQSLVSLALSSAVLGQSLALNDPQISNNRAAFVDRMVANHDFDRAELSALLESAVIDETVLQSISRPAERVVPWFDYREIFLGGTRIDAGAAFWRENTKLVDDTARQFGVEPEMILAIIGIESLFGQRMGRYRVLDSLSTLAFAYPPRARFFSSELEQFLLTARTEGSEHLGALGSYAGAMGAGQFISTSYEAYAVDGDSDGRRDLWTSWPDILASVANYFAEHGWRSGEAVAIAATTERQLATENGLELNTTVGALRAAGYSFDSSESSTTPAMIVGLEANADQLEYWVGFHNFRVITRYNRSVKYALAAHQLSLAIAAAYRAAPGEDL
jgi:membrane-bound lytic murein transglycosylase B